MVMEGCQGRPRTPTIHEKICPQCGGIIEIFSTDTQVACDNCGFIAYNDTLSCVQWCAYARKCVGDEMYERMMEIAAIQKQKAAEERQRKTVGGERRAANSDHRGRRHARPGHQHGARDAVCVDRALPHPRAGAGGHAKHAL